MDRNKILKMVVILACIVVIAGSLSRLIRRDSLTLAEYSSLNSSGLQNEDEIPDFEDEIPSDTTPDNSNNDQVQTIQNNSTPSGTNSSESSSSGNATPSDNDSSEASSPCLESENDVSLLPTGAALNGDSQLEQRVSLDDDFYYEPISDKLKRYMTGITYPDTTFFQNGGAASETDDTPKITFDELRYVHILHYDFDGNSVQGELICNEYIAQDVTEIFHELYRNGYQLERVMLMDEYDGDDDLSMEDNNTSCFNYRPVTNSANLSMHAYGLAVDVNPLYNPYISYSKEGAQEVLPASALAYADRSLNFPYKIDEDDLCYKLFIQHGFIWGGYWNNIKDYQHFEKAKPQ